MPFDATPSSAQSTAAEKLRRLADVLDSLDSPQLDLRTVHHRCGTAHCAWGWGEETGILPRPASALDGEEDDARWVREFESAVAGRSDILGLTEAQFRHCFGMGYQFRYLGRAYTPEDVARHLRETAAELEDA